MRINRLTQAISMAAVVGALAVAPADAQTTNGATGVGRAANPSMSGAYNNSQTWMNDAATRNNGRISRQSYLDEMGRQWDADPNHQGTRDSYLSGLRSRWDAMDLNNQGLTPAEASRISGNVDTSAGPTRSGTGTQTGNMGPGNAKGQ